MRDDNKNILDQLFKNQPSNNEFDVVLVIDRSGSMSKIRDDVIGGINTFIEEQKKEGGKAYISLVQFDTEYGDPAYWRKPMISAEPLNKDTYIPRGGTALFDAIGKTVAKVRELRASGEIAGKVQFVIQTDGEENSSKEFITRESVATLVNQVKDEGWGDFIFLGANIDAFSEGNSFGFSGANTVNYANTAVGVRGATYFASAQTKSFRYGDGLDAADVQLMQNSVAEGVDIEDLYAKIDAKINRGNVVEDTDSSDV